MLFFVWCHDWKNSSWPGIVYFYFYWLVGGLLGRLHWAHLGWCIINLCICVGFVVPFQVPVNKVDSIWNGKHDKYSFGYCSSRFSASCSSQENIENLPLEQHGLEHDLVPKPEGGHQTVFWISSNLKQLKALCQFCRPQAVIYFVGSQNLKT